ncbi:hypothetical protein IB238_07030 [Rhizobium sp. ARZ01]|nr:hypothetical protein [Rhizobium sp. ARZ01]
MGGGCNNRIEINLDNVSQLFETLDPYPFRERDLSKDAEEYIVDSARELPRDVALEMVIYLPKGSVDEDAAHSLGASVSTYFAHRTQAVGRQMRELFRVGRRAILVGLSILGLCLVAVQAFTVLLPSTGIVRFVEEGLVIVGWVALWRPLEIFLYDWWPLARERQLYRRLSQATVGIRYHKAPADLPPQADE